jgi:hypothetical protein
LIRNRALPTNLERKRQTPHPGPLPFGRGEGESSSDFGAYGGSGVQSRKSCFREFSPRPPFGRGEGNCRQSIREGSFIGSLDVSSGHVEIVNRRCGGRGRGRGRRRGGIRERRGLVDPQVSLNIQLFGATRRIIASNCAGLNGFVKKPTAPQVFASSSRGRS